MESSEYQQIKLGGLDANQDLIAQWSDLWTSKRWPEEMQRIRNNELEKKYPGITHVFNSLLNNIPWERKDQATEFPIAAAIVRTIMNPEHSSIQYKTLEIVSKATNMVKQTGISSNHAEKWVIEDALKKLGVEHLPDDCIVVSTVEPCSMCAGVIANADATTVIYGASQDDIRGRKVLANGNMKQHRAEPNGYDSNEFINQHRHDAGRKVTVEGGCCRNEVLSRMALPGQINFIKENHDLFKDEESMARIESLVQYEKSRFSSVK